MDQNKYLKDQLERDMRRFKRQLSYAKRNLDDLLNKILKLDEYLEKNGNRLTEKDRAIYTKKVKQHDLDVEGLFAEVDKLNNIVEKVQCELARLEG